MERRREFEGKLLQNASGWILAVIVA